MVIKDASKFVNFDDFEKRILGTSQVMRAANVEIDRLETSWRCDYAWYGNIQLSDGMVDIYSDGSVVEIIADDPCHAFSVWMSLNVDSSAEGKVSGYVHAIYQMRRRFGFAD